MRCPYCDAEDTRVVDSRPVEGGSAIRRRRACESCGDRFTTYERRQAALMVRKRSGHHEPFDAAKLEAGLTAAIADRPVPAGTVERLVRQIESWAEAQGPEIDSDDLGMRVLAELRDLDEVAYLRFASVYKDFSGPRDFEREMAELDGSE
ncbi:MAG: transcriptional regulator NrdR [Acidimicrobiia bacterium]|nr:transcriptional regulator NrdR [Acidimicrobiia bacterium]